MLQNGKSEIDFIACRWQKTMTPLAVEMTVSCRGSSRVDVNSILVLIL